MKNLFRIALGVAFFGAFVLFEKRRPFRPTVEGKVRHDLRNLALAGVSAVTFRLLESPAVMPLARRVEERKWGLVQRLPVPGFIKSAIAVLLMDYTLFIWHWLNHRVPFLWRFHSAHHIDLDMDASTALRFHFGEIALSVPWRAAQVIGIGVGPRELRTWQALTLMEITFQHSNVNLPFSLENLLGFLLVTPRMHGLHHSANPVEADCNWSSGLSVWDRIHQTHRTSGSKPVIGVAGMLDPSDVTLTKSLALPFHPTAAVTEYLETATRHRPTGQHRHADQSRSQSAAKC